MHILEEWRIRDVEQKAEQANRRLYELDSLRSDVGSLEHSLREVSAEAAELRSQLSHAISRIENLEMTASGATRQP